MKPGFETRRHFSHGSRGLDPSVTCLVETVAQNSWFSLLGCTQAPGQAVGMGLVLSREWGELQFGGITSPICPPRLGSCTCWVCHVFDLVVCGPTSPSTHSVSMLSPKLGATSSVTIHVPRPGELSFLRKEEESGVHPCFSAKNRSNWGLLLLPYLEKGQWWNYPSPWIKTAARLWGRLGSTPPPAAKNFLPAKSVPFPCCEEKHSPGKCLCSFPCPHLEVLADFNFCFLKDSNFFCYQQK